MDQLFAQLLGGGDGSSGGTAFQAGGYLVVTVPNHYAPLLGESFGGR